MGLSEGATRTGTTAIEMGGVAPVDTTWTIESAQMQRTKNATSEEMV